MKKSNLVHKEDDQVKEVFERLRKNQPKKTQSVEEEIIEELGTKTEVKAKVICKNYECECHQLGLVDCQKCDCGDGFV